MDDWWWEWQPVRARPTLTAEIVTTTQRGSILTVSFDIWAGGRLDTPFSAGFTVGWKRPRPWVMEMTLPGGPYRWQWREQA